MLPGTYLSRDHMTCHMMLDRLHPTRNSPSNSCISHLTLTSLLRDHYASSSHLLKGTKGKAGSTSPSGVVDLRGSSSSSNRFRAPTFPQLTAVIPKMHVPVKIPWNLLVARPNASTARDLSPHLQPLNLLQVPTSGPNTGQVTPLLRGNHRVAFPRAAHAPTELEPVLSV
ncbi:hypothetical protein LY76DRAFT_275784 [Colletotrichum caudatum]|nr:hypothetical protein LY76DRAFT_275784 [Colletotrichum caudatum]